MLHIYMEYATTRGWGGGGGEEIAIDRVSGGGGGRERERRKRSASERERGRAGGRGRERERRVGERGREGGREGGRERERGKTGISLQEFMLIQTVGTGRTDSRGKWRGSAGAGAPSSRWLLSSPDYGAWPGGAEQEGPDHRPRPTGTGTL